MAKTGWWTTLLFRIRVTGAPKPGPDGTAVVDVSCTPRWTFHFLLAALRALAAITGSDKAKHAVWSAVLVVALGVLALLLGIPAGPAILWSLLGTLAIGSAKELVWDRLLDRGRPEWGDLGANLMGIGFGYVVLRVLIAVG